MSQPDCFSLATQAVHAGYASDASHQHAIVPPIYAAAAFGLETAERGERLSSGEEDGFSYSRVANPTVDLLERRLAALEGGANAVAVGSGMAAVSLALLCAAEGGGRIIAPTNLYGASVDALATFFPQFGVHADFVDDINDIAQVEALIGPDTRAVFAESVANPSTQVTDIAALAEAAHRHGVPLIIDNTVPTPVLLRPIEHGADVVVHSTTKAIGGHGNSVGGVIIDSGRFDWDSPRFEHLRTPELVVSDERAGRWESFCSKYGRYDAYIRRVRIKYVRTFGAVLSPFNAYLQLTGVETLPQRIRQQTSSAARIARHLLSVPHVTRVHYASVPGASPLAGEDSQLALADRYLPDGIGGILSFEVDGGRENVAAILDSVRLFSYVANIGDTRSLIVDPARITHREVPAAYREAAGVTDNLIRLSIGLEDPADLIADLDQAIRAAY